MKASAEQVVNRVFVDALRDVLGLAPLYASAEAPHCYDRRAVDDALCGFFAFYGPGRVTPKHGKHGR